MSFNSKYTGQQVEDAIDKAMTATQTLSFTNLTASTWVEDSTYDDYGYRCDVLCNDVTSEYYAEVVFDLVEAVSGDYAPLCETKNGAVSIWSKVNKTINIPTILITK